ncbi:MAG: hypothetical protein COA65_02100 [Rhodospirillaceae bacterium]|nr:MAG: hypothetical protein COA65_02100 [Rhodospirillaceae bacterium]
MNTKKAWVGGNERNVEFGKKPRDGLIGIRIIIGRDVMNAGRNAIPCRRPGKGQDRLGRLGFPDSSFLDRMGPG